MMDARTLTLAPSRGLCVRSFEATDLPQVLRLYRQVFGADAAARFCARFRWSFEDNLCPADTSRWVLADGPTVVGFLGALPLPYRVDGQRIVAQTSCDFMVAPSHRFHGIQLMRELFRSCDRVVSCDDIPATIKVSEWLGARRAGTLVRHMKPLDARLLSERGRWRSVPRPLLWFATRGLRALDRLEGPLGPEVRPAQELDERFARFTRNLLKTRRIAPDRDAAFFEWRYGRASPHAHRQVGVILERDGQLAGYVIFARGRPPSRAGAVLDLQVLPEAPRGARGALLRYAARVLHEQGAWVLRYDELRPDDALACPQLTRLGFLPRGQQHLLVRLAEEEEEAAARAERWSLSYGDTESSHGSS